MYRFHLARNFRSLVFLLITASILGALGTLWWANRTGLPESWRIAIEREISQQGAHVKIGGLSYHPMRGVIATRVRVFSDPELKHEISSLERAVLNFDKTKLTRGIVHLTKVELVDAELILPVNPALPDSEVLEIHHANGTLFLPGQRRFEIRNASGRIAGIDVSLNARIIGYQQEGDGKSDDAQTGQRREFLARIIGELKKWHFDENSPPRVAVFIDGDANERSSVVAKFTLLAKQVEKNQHVLDEISAEAELTGDLLTVTSLRAKDSRGVLDGHFDYDISEKSGRFDLGSSLEIPPLLKAWFDIPPLTGILIGGTQTVEVEGGFTIDDQSIPQIQLTGHARCESVMLRGVRFDTVRSAFSWRNGDVFLRDLVLTRPDGEATAKALIQWPLVRLSLESTFPEQIFKPFFIDKPLENVIGDFSDRKNARVHIKLEGGFDATDHTSWAYTGSGRVDNVSYKGVPVNHAECRFSLSHHELDFYDGTIDFDYRNYALRKSYSGPNSGTAKVGRIRYDAAAKIVEVEAVTGPVWAAPLVRFFAPKIADSLEVYRFHTPPNLSGNGVVDVTTEGRTALDVKFSTAGAATYEFLGEDLAISKPSGKVAIRGSRVTIEGLKLDTLGGPVAAHFAFNGKGGLNGEMSWTRISISELTSTYGFQMKGGGKLTGRIDFSLNDGKVETMNGEGLFALEKSELFSVPIFGPLSPVISGVLSDRRAGFERATSAFCNFRINKGILSTQDFRTSTTSLVFAGDGQVDLKERTLDMTMRMNARGLLGLITLPLRPFYGMFQFRGTGPLKDTKWEPVMFTTPAKEQHELLLPAPKAKVVGGR